MVNPLANSLRPAYQISHQYSYACAFRVLCAIVTGPLHKFSYLLLWVTPTL